MSEKFSVGDKGFIYDRALSRKVRRRAATVVEIARAWMVVEVDDGSFPPKLRIRMSTQDDGSQSMYGAHFLTVEQDAIRQADREASAFLAEQGIRVDWSTPDRWKSPEGRIKLTRIIRAALESEPPPEVPTPRRHLRELLFLLDSPNAEDSQE